MQIYKFVFIRLRSSIAGNGSKKIFGCKPAPVPLTHSLPGRRAPESTSAVAFIAHFLLFFSLRAGTSRLFWALTCRTEPEKITLAEMGSQAAFLSVTTLLHQHPAATSKHSMCEHTFGNLISIDAEPIPIQYHSVILVIPRLVSGKCHSGMSLGCGVLQLRSDITMAPPIHSPAPSAPLLPVSQLPANRPRTKDLEALLQELEDVELKAVEAYFAKKEEKENIKANRALAQQTPEQRREGEKENIEEANRALAQQTPEERREAKKKQRAEEKKHRAEAKRAEQKKRWTWRRNKKPDDEEAVITAKLPQCYEEIKNLLWIEKNANPIYAKALEEWSRKEKLFTSRVEEGGQPEERDLPAHRLLQRIPGSGAHRRCPVQPAALQQPVVAHSSVGGGVAGHHLRRYSEVAADQGLPENHPF